MLIKSHEQLNQAVCETFFILQLSKMGLYYVISPDATKNVIFHIEFTNFSKKITVPFDTVIRCLL